MSSSRYWLAVALLATLSACREDAAGETEVLSGIAGENEAVAPPNNNVESPVPSEEPPSPTPAPPESPSPPPEEPADPPPPEPVVDIDGLPLPDLDTQHDYVAYLAARPQYYTRVTAPFGNVDRQDNTPTDNKVNNSAANLGRILFYDVRLSANNSLACASCHSQQHGFTDPKTFSDGFDGGKTGRHSMSLTNATYYENGRFFWDERARTLEEQVLMPIQDPVEMGMNLFDLEVKLAQTSFYGPLFTEVFGDEAITSNRISQALAQFIRTMVSYEAKFDQAFIAGEWDDPNFAAVFTEQEMQGLQLFTGFPGRESQSLGCVSCHQTTAFSMDQAHVNGLDSTNADDQGSGGGFFKAPSLRNIAVGGPYMHDGRLATLMDVVEFYNSGVQRHRTLSPILTRSGRVGGTPVQMNLSQQEKEALVAFLETLTDKTFLANPIFSDPFASQPSALTSSELGR